MNQGFAINFDSVRAPQIDDVMLWKYFADKGFAVQEIDFGFDDLEAISSLLQQTFPGSVRDFREYNRRWLFESDDFAIFVPNSANKACAIFARSYAVVHNVLDALNMEKPILRKIDPKSVSVVYYYPSRDEVHQNWITLKLADIPAIIPELYPSIDIAQLAASFKLSADPILLLYGVPGVGKTTFLKFLLSTGAYSNVAYVKDVSIMHKGEFWSAVAAAKHDMLIFDDLDFALAPRKEGDKGFVTNLLSYSDGLFSTKTKIVITTNQPIEKVDGAIVRPGRCFDFLTLEPLSYDEGQTIWTTLLGMAPEAFEILYKGEQLVTQAAIMSDYKRLTTQNQDREYLKRGNRRYSIEQKMAEHGVAVVHPERRGGFAKRS